MDTYRRRLLQGLAGTSAMALPAVRAQPAPHFPARAIRLYVPFGPGSGSDTYARYFGRLLGERLGQPVIVENKPGAGGAIAVAAVTTAPADGYSILLGSNSPVAVNVSVYRKLPYDPVADLTPLCGLTRSMAVILVPVNSPLHTLTDLVRRGKQQPLLNMGSYSAGYQLAPAPFLEKADITWQYVPYKGLGQTLTDLIGQQIDVAVVDAPGAVQAVKAGNVRALAVTGTQRHPDLPTIPTLLERGYPEAVHYSWTSLWVKQGTPLAIIEALSKPLLEILGEQASRAFVASSAGEIMPLGPTEMRQFQRAEIDRFAQAVRSLNFPLL